MDASVDRSIPSRGTLILHFICIVWWLIYHSKPASFSDMHKRESISVGVPLNYWPIYHLAGASIAGCTPLEQDAWVELPREVLVELKDGCLYDSLFIDGLCLCNLPIIYSNLVLCFVFRCVSFISILTGSITISSLIKLLVYTCFNLR